MPITLYNLGFITFAVVRMKKLTLVGLGCLLSPFATAQSGITLSEDYLADQWATSITLDKNKCLEVIEKMDAGQSKVSQSFIQPARTAQEFTGYCQLNGTTTFYPNNEASNDFVFVVKVDMFMNPLVLGEVKFNSASKWQVNLAKNEIFMSMKKEDFNINLSYRILNEQFKMMLTNGLSDHEIEAMKQKAIADVMASLPSEMGATNRIEIIDNNKMRITNLDTKIQFVFTRK